MSRIRIKLYGSAIETETAPSALPDPPLFDVSHVVQRARERPTAL